MSPLFHVVFALAKEPSLPYRKSLLAARKMTSDKPINFATFSLVSRDHQQKKRIRTFSAGNLFGEVIALHASKNSWNVSIMPFNGRMISITYIN